MSSTTMTVLDVGPSRPPPAAREAVAARRSPMAVAHVVLSMDVGGAERNVLNQVREGRKLGQDVSIVCLERPGTLAPAAEALGARVVCLDKPPGVRLGTALRFRRALR